MKRAREVWGYLDWPLCKVPKERVVSEGWRLQAVECLRSEWAMELASTLFLLGSGFGLRSLSSRPGSELDSTLLSQYRWY